MNKKIKTKHCPYCKEIIREDAINCKHCHYTIWPTCPYCKEKIESGAIKCIHCLSALLFLALKIVPARTRKLQHTVNPKRRMTYAEKRFKEHQVIKVLKQLEGGRSVRDVWQECG